MKPKLGPMPREMMEYFRNIPAAIKWLNRLQEILASTSLVSLSGTDGHFAKYDSGGNLIDSGKVVTFGDVVGTTDSQTLSGKTLASPVIGNFEYANHSHQATSSGGKIDHGAAISGLSDDDHTQYVLANGTRDIQFSSDSIGIGNVSGGNYLEVEADGTPLLHGNGTYWVDEKVSAFTTKTVGASNLPGADFLVGTVGAFWFDPNTMNQVFFMVQIPHAYKEGSSIYPHVHWCPGASNGTAGQKVRWGLEYAWGNLGGTFTATTTIYAQDHSPADSVLVSKKHYLTPFSAISGTGKTISSMVVCRLFRDATNATYDTYANFAGLLSIDFHIECDSLGSHQEYTK